MSPSHPHEDLTTIFDDIVDAAGSTLTGAVKKLRSLRLRGPGDPPGTGMEPDCAFYVGERANAYYAARDDGKRPSRPSSNVSLPTWWSRSRSPMPTKARPNATGRWGCASCGVCTAARIRGAPGGIPALCPGRAPRMLEASQVLEGLRRRMCTRRWKRRSPAVTLITRPVMRGGGGKDNGRCPITHEPEGRLGIQRQMSL